MANARTCSTTSRGSSGAVPRHASDSAGCNITIGSGRADIRVDSYSYAAPFLAGRFFVGCGNPARRSVVVAFMRHRPFALSLASLLLAFVVPARADFVSGTRGDELLAETRDLVALTVDHGHATFVVRRTFHNSGTKFDQAV